MSVSVENLLDAMTVRYNMQRDGIANPSLHIKYVTKLMVAKLSELDKSEEIEIRVLERGPNIRAQYIRKLTRELLAEINEAANKVEL